MGFNMKTTTTLKTAAIVISLATASTQVFAQGEVRGAISAVNHVASAIITKSNGSTLQWGKKAQANGAVVNTSEPAQGGIRWADKRSVSNHTTAAVEAGSGVVESGSRWVLRNDAEQAGSRWVLRNDAEQAGSRWVLRNDAEQAGSRWVLR